HHSPPTFLVCPLPNLFVSLIIPPPPLPPLFPYTTLFRSTLACPPSLPSVPTSRATRVTSDANDPSWFTIVLTVLALRRNSPSRGDRKSTRLNSSHRTISYAVFCLKKKKKKNK